MQLELQAGKHARCDGIVSMLTSNSEKQSFIEALPKTEMAFIGKKMHMCYLTICNEQTEVHGTTVSWPFLQNIFLPRLNTDRRHKKIKN